MPNKHKVILSDRAVSHLQNLRDELERRAVAGMEAIENAAYDGLSNHDFTKHTYFIAGIAKSLSMYAEKFEAVKTLLKSAEDKYPLPHNACESLAKLLDADSWEYAPTKKISPHPDMAPTQQQIDRSLPDLAKAREELTEAYAQLRGDSLKPQGKFTAVHLHRRGLPSTQPRR